MGITVEHLFFGGVRMINILYIGQYNGKGKLSTIQWECYIEWCKIECNKMIIYSHMFYDIICSKFPLYCTINELEKPDITLDVYAYEVKVTNKAFWNYIKDCNNYNIDMKDDISHIFFFSAKRKIASLEIVDYENYILIEDPINSEKIWGSQSELIRQNIQFCRKGVEDIEELVEGENWRPLGFMEREITCST